MASITDVALSDLTQGLAGLRLRSDVACQEMERSLARHGQIAAVIACRHGDGLEVADGFKRLEAARRLGWRELRTEVRELDRVGAMLLVIHANAGSRLSEVEEAWVVRSLYRVERLSQPQIAQLMGRHKSWVCRRLMLAEGLSEGVEASLRLGLVSATAAREIARLPRGNQDAAAEAIARRGFTCRQAGKLVDELLRAPDETARRVILAEVEAWTRASGQDAKQGGQGPEARRPPGERLVTDALAMGRMTARLQARLLAQPLRALGAPATEIAVRGLAELRPGLLSLCRTIERVIAEAGVGDVELA